MLVEAGRMAHVCGAAESENGGVHGIGGGEEGVGGLALAGCAHGCCYSVGPF